MEDKKIERAVERIEKRSQERGPVTQEDIENLSKMSEPYGPQPEEPPRQEAAVPMPRGEDIIPRFDRAAVEATMANFKLLSEVLKKNMVRGHHYGKFPGWQNDQLLEPGASLIMNGFGVYADPRITERFEDDEGHFRYNVVVYLHPIKSACTVVAAGVGSASTREVKYAYRWVPEQDIPKGYEKVELRSKLSASRTLYRVPNEELGDLENTVLKMATKRAEVDACNHLPGVSELFPRQQPPQA